MGARETGDMGERYAAGRMEKEGYVILARNYRAPCGELDIVAQRGEILAFVEVKTRGANRLSTPGGAVGRQKQQRIIRTAQWYLLEHPTHLQPRFDVAEVTLKPAQEFDVETYHYLEGAFMLHETD